MDGVAIGPHVNLDELLQHKVDKRVALDISGNEVIVRPVASLADQIYRKWVEDNRAYVAKISNGRLGYVHMRDMSEQALTQLYLDLDAENRAQAGRGDRYPQQQRRIRERHTRSTCCRAVRI